MRNPKLTPFRYINIKNTPYDNLQPGDYFVWQNNSHPNPNYGIGVVVGKSKKTIDVWRFYSYWTEHLNENKETYWVEFFENVTNSYPPVQFRHWGDCIIPKVPPLHIRQRLKEYRWLEHFIFLTKLETV